MQIMYVEDKLSYLKQILNEVDCSNFFDENKLILLSKHPYVIDNHNMMCKISPQIGEELKHCNINQNIMYIASGHLAYTWTDNEFQILNYGPSFREKDLVDFPIRYYQEKERKWVDSISFHYDSTYLGEHFDMDNLNGYLNEIGSKNNKLYNALLDFDRIAPVYNQQDRITDSNQRKVIFVPAEGVLYGNATIDIKNSKEVLQEYLNAGNFLVLLTYTGNHYGFPFSIDIADVLDTKNYTNMYREMLNFFRSLNIQEDQVSNFKISYTGINYKGGCYNFGFSWNNVDQFFKIYLEYLKIKGYNIAEVYVLDRGKTSYTSQNTRSIRDQYNLEIVASQEDFNRVVKKKILK